MSDENEPTVEDYIRELAGEEPKPKPEPEAEDKEAAATSDDGDDEATEESSEETEGDEDDSSEEQEASSDDEADEDEEEKPKRRRSRPDPKKRIRKLVAQRNAKEDENARLRAQIDVLMKQAQQPQPAADQTPQKQDDPQPKQEEYSDYAKYLEDRSAWASRQAVKRALVEARTQAAETHKQQIAQARETEMVTQAKALFAKGIEEFEDFEEIAADPALPVTDAMTSAMLASDIGHQVQYHLGNHPEEATRISQLSPVQQVREMALLEASLKAPKPAPKKKTTNAPEPIKPVGGKSAPRSIDEDTMPIDEYMRRYNAGELPSQR